MQRFPVVVAIDVEPDRRVVTRRPEPLLGFEKLLTLVSGLRDQLASVVDAPISFTWLLRMDPQIVEAYGSSTALVEMYGRELAELESAGDEIGLHIHCWRWKGQWIEDNADIGLARALRRRLAPRLPRGLRSAVPGEQQRRRVHVRTVCVDSSTTPGSLPTSRWSRGCRAKRTMVPSEVAIGWYPDLAPCRRSHTGLHGATSERPTRRAPTGW